MDAQLNPRNFEIIHLARAVRILFLPPRNLRPYTPACFSTDSLWPWCRLSGPLDGG